MSDTITVTGIVATEPRHVVTSSGLAITSFRLASGQRRFDRSRNTWVDADTNWYTVSAFRHLARNAGVSVHKGEHVIVAGRLRIRNWQNGDRAGTTIEVEADSIGHDLTWCTTRSVRSVAAAQSVPAAPDAAEFGEPQDDGQPAGPDDREPDPVEDEPDEFLPRDARPFVAVES